MPVAFRYQVQIDWNQIENGMDGLPEVGVGSLLKVFESNILSGFGRIIQKKLGVVEFKKSSRRPHTILLYGV